MLAALQSHWPEYLMEAWGLGTFMLSACLCTALLEYPASPVHGAIPNATLRRFLLGLGMGLTATAITYSPWGKRSGAHINPAVTIAFFRLKKIAGWDALFYVPAQFAGGLAGVLFARALLPQVMSDQSVKYVVTIPGERGTVAALVAELVIAFVLMSVVLTLGNIERTKKLTGLATGVLVTTFVFFTAPISGFGMNPARTAASAIPSGIWTAWWLYAVAPPVAMLLATEAYVRVRGLASVACAKIHHAEDIACIFCGQNPESVAKHR